MCWAAKQGDFKPEFGAIEAARPQTKSGNVVKQVK